MAIDTTPIATRIPTAIAEMLRRQADDDGTTVSKAARRAVIRGILAIHDDMANDADD
jgi:hypothetical protein